MADVEPSASDLRFQFDVIKGQSESIRVMTATLLEMQRTLSDQTERLVRIESNRVDSRVTSLEAKVEQMEAERNQRVGMARVVEMIFKSPLVGWIVGAAGLVWFTLSGKGPQ